MYTYIELSHVLRELNAKHHDRRDLFLHVTRRIHTCDMTYLCMKNLYIYIENHVHVCVKNLCTYISTKSLKTFLLIHVTRRTRVRCFIYMCDMTLAYERRKLLLHTSAENYVIHFGSTCDTTHSHGWNDSFICTHKPTHTHAHMRRTCEMTHLYVRTHPHTRTHTCDSRLLHTSDTCFYTSDTTDLYMIHLNV